MPVPPETMRLVHLVFLSLWGGMVLAEAVVELAPLRLPALAQPAAIFHYYIDLYVEIPLLALVVFTGVVNLFLVPFSALLLIKLLAVAPAVCAQVVCLVLVVRRHRQAGTDGAGIAGLHRKIIWCALFGVPFALAAAALGLIISAKLMAGA